MADAIASHGQTIFHNPAEGYTLQIGHGASIAEATGLPVVADFRSADVALGGQGAPLVPMGDKLLFGAYNAALNIGGFANISFNKPEGQRISFDICPANIVLNQLCQQIGLPYDSEGRIARHHQSEVDSAQVQRLDAHPYFKQPYPKSLGAEWVGPNLSWLLDAGIDNQRIIATYTAHIANQIAASINQAGNDLKVLATGGGVHNTFLMESISKKLREGNSIEIPSEDLINFKEALIFAFLGHLRLQNLPNCLPSVTGARKAAVGGAVYIPGQGILL
jgi:anhydro-N-acetylmuramic acid kinase